MPPIIRTCATDRIELARWGFWPKEWKHSEHSRAMINAGQKVGSQTARDKDSGEATMTTLGNAIYLIGCVAAVPFLAFAGYLVAAFAGYFGRTIDPVETEIFAKRMTAMAVGSWLVGRIAGHSLADT